MSTTELFNLDLGDKHPGRGLGEVQVGPFVVRLVDDYDVRVREVPQNASRVDSYNPETNEETVSFKDARGAGWHVTATATLVGAPERSILTQSDADDGGLWDLCALLTFLTGRRVVTGEDRDRYAPRPGGPACLPIAALATASSAWANRGNLVGADLVSAFNLYNEALPHDVLQVFAALYNTSINAVLDRWTLPLAKVAPETRKALKEKVVAVVNAAEELSVEEREGYAAKLGASVDQGLAGLTEKLTALLVDLGIVPAALERADEGVVRRRIKFVNTVRNQLTHSGDIPRLRGLDAEQARRHTVAITSGVAPDILKLAFGRVLALDPERFGIHSAVMRDLVLFFSEGEWRGWPLAEKSFDEWFRGEGSLF